MTGGGEPDPIRLTLEAAARRDQHGALSRYQAMVAGMSRTQIKRRVDRRQWVPVGPRGWYALADCAADPLARLTAATLALDAPAWGPSALALFDLADHPPQPMVAARRRYQGRGVSVVWVEGLEDVPTTKRHGLATVTAETAIAAQARWLGLRGLHSLIDEAVRCQVTTWDRIEGALTDLPRRGRAGSGRMEAVRVDRSVDAAIPLSDWGRDLVLGLEAAGLPVPRMEWRIHDDAGVFVAQVDAAYPNHRIAIELDSVQFHLSREAFELDRWRDAQLGRLGWHVLRVTWTHWADHRANVVETVRCLLADARLEPRQPRPETRFQPQPQGFVA